MKEFSVKGDEVRHGAYVFLDALSKEIIASLETQQIPEALLPHLHSDSRPLYPMTAATLAREFKADDGMAFALCLQTNQACIGFCRLTNVNWKSRHAQLYIGIIDETYYTVDLLSDVIQTLLQFVYWEANLNRIYIHCLEDNALLQQALKSRGFSDEGHLRQGAYQSGHYLDIVIYSILAREWLANSSKTA